MPKSSPELITALDREMQLMSGASVMLSQCVAALSGLSATDLECLGAVELGGGASAGELAQLTGLSTGAITGVIDRLEQAGYVRRVADPADRRKVLVRPEPKVAEVAELYQPLAEEVHALWADYGDERIALVVDFLARSRKVAERHLAALQARSEAAASGRAPIRARRR